MKDCFSYIRFSSEGQKDGNSLERQNEIAPRIAKEKGWNLRTDLNAKDLGVSAYKGHNIETLESIIKAAKDGKIPQGTVMIIEALDRLTREQLKKARRLFEDILEAGIEIYVDRLSRHFTKNSNNDVIDLIIVMVELNAAHEYSAKLSSRLKAANASKRNKIANGERVKMANFPSWIEQKTWTVNHLGKLIQNIFEMYLNGKGPGLIARELNQTKIATFTGKGLWSHAFIYKLLSNRQLMGEYSVNGEAVKNYLPLVVTEETFLKVQSKLNDNKGKHRTGDADGENVYNIFAGVAECSCCGHKIKVVKQGTYMTCYGAIKGVCKQTMITFGKFESSFASMLKLKADELVADETGNTVNTHVQILNGQLVEIQKQITTCETAIEDCVTNNRLTALSVLDKKLNALKSEETTTKRKLELESAKKVTLNGASNRFHKMLSRFDSLKTDTQLRVTVQGWIRENINRLTVDRGQRTFTADFKNGNVITMNFDGSFVSVNKSFVELFGKNTENLATTYQEMTFKTA